MFARTECAVHTFIFINKGAYNAWLSGAGTASAYSRSRPSWSGCTLARLWRRRCRNVRYWRRMAIERPPVGLLVVMLAIWWFLCCRNGFCILQRLSELHVHPCMKFGVPFSVELPRPLLPRSDNRPIMPTPRAVSACSAVLAPLTKDVSKGCHAPYPRNNAFRARMYPCDLHSAHGHELLRAAVTRRRAVLIEQGGGRGGALWRPVLELEEHARHLNESAGLILARSAEAMRSDSLPPTQRRACLRDPRGCRRLCRRRTRRACRDQANRRPNACPARPTFAPSWLPTLEPSSLASLIDVYEPDGSVSSINLRRLRLSRLLWLLLHTTTA